MRATWKPSAMARTLARALSPVSHGIQSMLSKWPMYQPFSDCCIASPQAKACRAGSTRPQWLVGLTSRSGDELRLVDRLRRRGGVGRGGRVDWAVDTYVRQELVGPAGQPPVAVAEQFHRGGDEHHPHEGGVDEDGGGHADADQLQEDLVAGHEGQEDSDHDGSGSSHDAGTRRAPV